MRTQIARVLYGSIFLIAASALVQATGRFAPSRWLDHGGVASDMSPEFYWELELRKMAAEFTPTEKRIAPPKNGQELESQSDLSDTEKALAAGTTFTERMDSKDFEDALVSGRLTPKAPELARAAHEAARQIVSKAKITSEAELPTEYLCEFADYHRGAFAFRKGSAHFSEARLAWEALLNRPKEERHYRSTWAAFMLGKLALAENKPTAVKWFVMTRELAKSGFSDSLGLAADSYGWQALSELKRGNDEAAAKLYLTQLALGDLSAIVSLKAVIPDRPTIDGMINYGEKPPENATLIELQDWEKAQAPKIQARLDAAASSPILRRLQTIHVLATETWEQYWSYGVDAESIDKKPGARCRRWLATLRKAGIRNVDNADYIGWVSYSAGRYADAANWLGLAKPDSTAGLWLKAKLLRRDGKLLEAAKAMEEVVTATHAQTSPERSDSFFVNYGEGGYQPYQSAAADLASIHLSLGHFSEAFRSFLKADLWQDAGFIGDRVMTVDELKRYVDAHLLSPPPNEKPKEISEQDIANGIRWMLGRRLVRESRYDEARPYLPSEYQQVLDRYTSSLRDGNDTTAPKFQRARALFTAAWIARRDGMEIMGTEMEPDGFESSGNFAPNRVDLERAEGVRVSMEYDEAKKSEVEARKPIKIFIPATADEKQRIANSQPHPATRFHYRWVASAIAWKAAALLPDGSEELADVLNTAGSWIKNRDEKAANQFIQSIEKRCPNTKIGRTARRKHWFVEMPGPWSEALTKQSTSQNGTR